jgi:hypothetical protein
MDLLGDVIAGCAVGASACTDQTEYPGIRAWFDVLVLVLAVLVLLTFVVAGARLIRRRSRRRSALAQGAVDSAALASLPSAPDPA